MGVHEGNDSSAKNEMCRELIGASLFFQITPFRSQFRHQQNRKHKCNSIPSPFLSKRNQTALSNSKSITSNPQTHQEHNMALSDGKTRSTRLAFQQDTPAEHVTLPAETGSTPVQEVEEEEEGEEEEESDTDALPPNSVWRRTLTVEQEDFLRDVGIAVKGMEPGTLDRWIEQNEAMYDRRNVMHWHHLSWDNAEYHDRYLAGGESRELPERILAAYRSVVLRDLKGTESPSPGQEGPEGTADIPGTDPMMNKQEDTTQVHSPDVPAGQATSQAGGRTEPLQSQERNQWGASEPHGSTGKEAAVYWQSTLGLLH